MIAMTDDFGKHIINLQLLYSGDLALDSLVTILQNCYETLYYKSMSSISRDINLFFKMILHRVTPVCYLKCISDDKMA